MNRNSIHTITKIMAMSIEKLNQKLEKVLKNLDKAIEDRELQKAIEVIKDIRDLNQKSEGQQNDAILTELENRVKEITEEIKDDDVNAEQAKKLKGIRKQIEDASNPFKNIKAVVASLQKQDFSQEDLKQYKEGQKNDNLAQIDGIKRKNQEIAYVMTDIENRYIEKIDNNDAIIKIIEDIKKKKAKLDILDEQKDKEAIEKIRSDIKAKLSEMGTKGVDVSSIQNFESDPSQFDTFINGKRKELEAENQNLVDLAAKDETIPASFRKQYNFENIKTSRELKNIYEKMAGTRQKNSFKITTLEAENKQIDQTIETLEKEEEIKNIAYNEKGEEKSISEIVNAVRSDSTLEGQIKKEVDNKFDGNFFARLGARKNYYKETENIGGFKAFFKACFSFTKTVKQIEARSLAYKKGKDMSNSAIYNSEKRKNDFKEAIRKEATKKMSKSPKMTENNIKREILNKAYDSVVSKDKDSDESAKNMSKSPKMTENNIKQETSNKAYGKDEDNEKDDR